MFPYKYKTEVLSSRSKIKNNWFGFNEIEVSGSVYVAPMRPIEPQQYRFKKIVIRVATCNRHTGTCEVGQPIPARE
jgi:hypothetical protein